MTQLKSFENGFSYLEINNLSCSAKIALQGAHLFEFTPVLHDNLLWLSPISEFTQLKAIRGGIPICWPSFGNNNPNLSQHGFARTSLFELISSEDIDANTTQVVLKLTDTKASRKLWNYMFELKVTFIFSDTLSVSLQTTNKGTKAFTITQALHTYFNISDIYHVEISGLDTKPCFDALTQKTEPFSGNITFNQEFDRVFQNLHDNILLKDRNSSIEIQSSGSSSAVVWNPWSDKCAKMSAMEPEAYREFVCIESANAYEDFKVLKPKELHTLKATFTSL